MKNITMALIMVLATCVVANAKPPSQQQGASMSPGMMKEMPMMPCMAMMKQAMGQDMALYEMMQMMKDIIAIQERLTEGTVVRDRKRMLSDLSAMKERLGTMMTGLSDKMKGTMSMPAAPPAGGKDEAPQAAPEQAPPPQNLHQH